MREERGKLAGDLTVNEPMEFSGSLNGNITVVDGGKLYMRGVIYGNLTVHNGGRVHIFGNVGGDVTILEGGKVIHGGIVGSSIVNRGGRLHVEAAAKVVGKIKTRSGKTTFDSGSPLKE